eukprot:13054077-Heterocapsa_arctica.AAC.1
MDREDSPVGTDPADDNGLEAYLAELRARSGPAGAEHNFDGNKTDLRKPKRRARGGSASTPDEVAQSE